MKRHPRIRFAAPLLAASALALLAIVPPAASAQQVLPNVTAAPAATASAGVTGYRRLEDMKVVHQSGEKIGEVDSVLVDANGRVIALVIDVERFLGIGEDDVVVGFDHLRYVNGVLVTALSKDQIASMPRWKP